jgi:Tol biopolymer transport system component
MECLTCGLGLRAINNPDYSRVNNLVLFSAQWSTNFHNYLFTLDFDRNLVQITDDDAYMDFDCSWSEDGQRIVFNRLPEPFFSQPSGVWLMNHDGSGLDQLTEGGPNLNDEGPHGPYPIGIDADPDLSPDNSQIVFSRLRTGMENKPFGVYELVLLDLESREITILDSSFANMIPEWKEGGILIIRQIGTDQDLMELKQSIYLYNDGKFENLEPEFDTFPIGSNGASWVE